MIKRISGNAKRGLVLCLSLSALLSDPANALVFGQFGSAFALPTDYKKVTVKCVEFGYQGIASHVFDYRLGVGGWAQTGRHEGMVNSGYGHVSLGLETKDSPVYAHYFLGGAYVVKNDLLLGSNLQVIHTLGIGLRDWRDIRIGISVKHLSNGGATPINQGRNFALIEAAF